MKNFDNWREHKWDINFQVEEYEYMNPFSPSSILSKCVSHHHEL